MKKNIGIEKKENPSVSEAGVCGNCWGHQEYSGNYEEKLVDIGRTQKENFITKFVNKYIR